METEQAEQQASTAVTPGIGSNPPYSTMMTEGIQKLPTIKTFSVVPSTMTLFSQSKLTTDIESFNTESTQYNREIAYFLSIISGWSYADGEDFTSKLQYYGLFDADVTQIQVTNDAMSVVATAYFVMTKEGVGILSFRGTEPANIINWLTDANTMQQPFMGGKIHSGFLNNTKELWNQISTCIDSAVGLKSLYITGHSLGAAMAAVATIKMHQDNQDWWSKLRGVYTFGQPMVANSGLARLCQKNFGDMFYRHVFARDVVPRVPSRDLGDFKHFGVELLADSPYDQWQVVGKRRQTKPSYFVITTLFGVGFSFLEKRLRLPLLDTIANIASNEIFLSMDDHSPLNYIETCYQSL
jgi:hypothetical protein